MIRLTEVAKEYPRSGVALAHISFQVKKGEFVFLTGPSGSGKTTILKLLYMDDKPSEGEVWINGVSSRNASGREISRLRRRIGIVFQDFRLLEDRTAEANEFSARAFRGGAAAGSNRARARQRSVRSDRRRAHRKPRRARDTRRFPASSRYQCLGNGCDHGHS